MFLVFVAFARDSPVAMLRYRCTKSLLFDAKRSTDKPQSLLSPLMVLLLLSESTSVLVLGELRVVRVDHGDVTRHAVMLLQGRLAFSNFVTNTIRINPIFVPIGLRILVDFLPFETVKLLGDLLGTKERKTQVGSG
jgi:hypothetical protein